MNVDKTINLCDTCLSQMPDCPATSDDVSYGNGPGDDNVYQCNHYTNNGEGPDDGLKAKISKLKLSEGEYLVISVPHPISAEQIRRISEDVMRLIKPNKCFITYNGVKIESSGAVGRDLHHMISDGNDIHSDDVSSIVKGIMKKYLLFVR